MSIRQPLRTVLTSTNSGEDGTNSVLGGIAVPFLIPQDTDNVTVKMQATTSGGGVSATLQTTDDGGTTWFDVGRTSIVSSATGVLSEWLSMPVNGFGIRTTPNGSVVATGSVQATGNDASPPGSAAPSTLASKSYSGLPILSPTARIFLQTQTAAIGTVWITEVKVNSQSATA